jgi:serine protein kinase
MNILKQAQKRFSRNNVEEMTLVEFLEKVKANPSIVASPAERLLKAIGEPELIDTRKDPRLSRIHSNKVIKVYPSLSKKFYGLEKTIDDIVSFLTSASQGLEESKQILYLLGPVGGGKSSLADELRRLMQQEPIYCIKGSPIQESPLNLLSKDDAAELGINPLYIKEKLSPWAIKRLKESGGDVTKFTVEKRYPSQDLQVSIARVEPSDENNQDTTCLVGQTAIRQLESYDQNDPDCYLYSGGLCKANQGMLEFVEMFKAPIKTLNPLLTATQEGHFAPSQPIGLIPFDGIILAHSNESEWSQFKNDKTNEAFIDRVYLVKVPYCLRISEEKQIYEKLINNSNLKGAPCTPRTLDLLAEFAVLSRLKEAENSSIFTKAKVYNGENMKEKDHSAKTLEEYKDLAGVTEGMDQGVSTRFCFKVLSKTFNFDTELGANPVHLLRVLKDALLNEQLPEDTDSKYSTFIEKHLAKNLFEFIEKEIQTNYLEAYSEYGQNLFDRYIDYADMWIQDQDCRDPDTGELLDRDSLDKELKKLEIPAQVVNYKDFRNEVVNFVLRYRSTHTGKNPSWKSYEKLRQVIEKNMFSKTEDLIPIVTFGAKQSKDDQKKHDNFVDRFLQSGYTKRQVKILVEYYVHNRHKA